MFSPKRLNLATSGNLYAIILSTDAKKLGFESGERVTIFPTEDKKRFVVCELEILCTKDLNKKNFNLKKEEIGIVGEAYDKLNLKKHETVSVLPAQKPRSVELIKEKFLGKKKLNETEFREILKDIISNTYSQIETTYFVLACMVHKLDDKETIALTKAMVSCGNQLHLQKHKDDIIVDKHCIGGIPGNRTTMVVVPIVAAAGLTIPKTSSRSITSPAGTADTMEALTDVELTLTKFHEVLRENNGCVAWGGTLGLSPADGIIINVEHPLEIDSEGQMIASILSKKKSVGATHVLLDIPIGTTAKVKSRFDALRLQKRFEKVGKAIGLKMKVVLTDGSEPIGRGIGPTLEAKDVLSVLRNDENCPQRLKRKAIYMAGVLLEMGKVAHEGQGELMAKEILESGRALEKFENIIKAQGKPKKLNTAKYIAEFKAEKSGKITSINNKIISKIAFRLGAPKDKESGLYLRKRVGDNVKKDETIFELHSDSRLKIRYAKSYLREYKAYEIN